MLLPRNHPLCCWRRTRLPHKLPGRCFAARQDLAGTAAGHLPDSLELRWSFKTDGPVKSSAAIEGERVVVGSDDKHVYCLDFLHWGKDLGV